MLSSFYNFVPKFLLQCTIYIYIYIFSGIYLVEDFYIPPVIMNKIKSFNASKSKNSYTF